MIINYYRINQLQHSCDKTNESLSLNNIARISIPHPTLSLKEGHTQSQMRYITNSSGLTHIELPNFYSFRSRLSQQVLPDYQAASRLLVNGIARDLIDTKTCWPKPLFRNQAQSHLCNLQDQVQGIDNGAYGVIDIINLNGINAAAGYTEGQVIFGKITSLVKSCLEEIPGIELYRHGGDEFSICLAGSNAAETLKQQIYKAQRIVQDFLVAPYFLPNGQQIQLTEIPHTKKLNSHMHKGTGFLASIVPIVKNTHAHSIIRTADVQLELLKKQRPTPEQTTQSHQLEIGINMSKEIQKISLTHSKVNTCISASNENSEKLSYLPTRLRDGNATANAVHKAQKALNTDELTGFKLLEGRNNAIQKVLSQPNSQLSAYIECDITNLGGLNAYLSCETADTVLQAFAALFKNHISAEFKHVHFFRHGGDEFSALVEHMEIEAVEKLEKALNQAVKHAQTLAHRVGLNSVPHPKYTDKFGTGIKFGIAYLPRHQQHGLSINDITTHADNDLKARFLTSIDASKDE